MNRNILGWLSQGRISIGLGAVVTGLIVFAILSRQPNQWRSQAKLLIQLPQAPYIANADWSRAGTTYAQLARGPNVLSAVIALTHVLETPDSLAAMITVTLVPDTQLLAVEVTAGDSTTAQNLADELA